MLDGTTILAPDYFMAKLKEGFLDSRDQCSVRLFFEGVQWGEYNFGTT